MISKNLILKQINITFYNQLNYQQSWGLSKSLVLISVKNSCDYLNDKSQAK